MDSRSGRSSLTEGTEPGGTQGERPDASTRREDATGASRSTDGQEQTPSISAPKGGGALRSLDEKFSVNPATGTMSLTLTLDPSPSRSDFHPDLSLSYNSGSGTGPFGLGWSLSLPSVSRKTAKGLPRYDGEDVFVLSDTEDLVPVLDKEGSEQIPRVEDRTEEGRSYRVHFYRPRTEERFARIERWVDQTTGETHWRTTSEDNVTRIYGRTPQHRVADPDDPSRIFRWLLEESRDDRGNLIQYEYIAEDTRGVDAKHPEERHRLHGQPPVAKRYPKRILYGNRNRQPDEPGDWMFEVVFDYGDHNRNPPTPEPDSNWSVRDDPFSNYRAGFEIRTYRLCRRVLMFHRFPDLEPNPTLVRSTDLKYKDEEADEDEDKKNAFATYLRSVIRRGYVWNDEADQDDVEAMPPVSLAYRRPEPGRQPEAVDTDDLGDAPSGLADNRYRLVDLDGEGLPGILVDDGDKWYYKSNRGRGQFGPARPVDPQPSVADLGSGRQRLTDLEGDGRKDLVILADGLEGSQVRTKEGWEPHRPFDEIPNVEWNDPNVRWVDLTGDGQADLLITEEDDLVWHPGRGSEGFGPAARVPKSDDETEGPAVVFADGTESIHLADVSGDGMQDLIRVRNGEVAYWPSLGWGRFGAKITMANAPRFAPPDQFDPARIRLADVDGSGTTDILYVGDDAVQIWLNASGNAWHEGTPITSLPHLTDPTQVQVADLLGKGTPCLVWSSPLPDDGAAPLWYVDLMPGGKPHLLTQVENGRGQVRRIEYCPSTAFYLEARREGRPWITTLPFPVHVVSRVEIEDQVAETLLVSRYRYHHGYFDGHEREFRGFGLVEQWDAEDFDPDEDNRDHVRPPVHTKTWYHTGAYVGRDRLSRLYAHEYYDAGAQIHQLPDTQIPGGMTADEEREACRALRGRLLRREIYARDGSDQEDHPYTVTERTYQTRLLQPRSDNPHAVFYVHQSEALTHHLERDPGDPRILHEFTLDVDDYGNVTRRASVAYPRPAPSIPEQDELLVTVDETDVVNLTDGPDRRIGLPVERRSFELTGLTAPDTGVFDPTTIRTHADAATPIPFEADPPADSVAARLYRRSRTRYYQEDLDPSEPLPPGEVNARGLVYRTERQAFTPGLLDDIYGSGVTSAELEDAGYILDDGAWWAPSPQEIFNPDGFYRPVEVKDPFGNSTKRDYDDHWLLLEETRDPLGNVVQATNDYRVLQPDVVTDPNDNREKVGFDMLGRVDRVAVTGKEEDDPDGPGDSLDSPTRRFHYDLHAWQNDGMPVSVHRWDRETHGNPASKRSHQYTYFDGSGREIMRKVQAEPGEAPARTDDGELERDEDGNLVWEDTSPDKRWVGTGRVVRDNKGQPVRQYEPYFDSIPAFEDEDDLVEWGVADVLHYDPLDRRIKQDNPDGTFTEMRFDAWRTETWDENDTVDRSAWYAERAEPGADAADRRAAELAERHAGTPSVVHLDVLGREVLTVETEGGPGDRTLKTRVDLSIEGNPLTVTDPEGRPAVRQRWDMLGRKIHTQSIDSGERTRLLDVRGNPVQLWTPRGHVVTHRYDELRRATHRFVRSPGGSEVLVRRTLWGETLEDPNARSQNLRGRAHLRFDGAGLSVQERFDFKGNLLRSRRRLTSDATATPDWSALDTMRTPEDALDAAEPTLDDESFEIHNEWDALDRLTKVTDGRDAGLQIRYNEAGFLDDVRMRSVGDEDWQTVVRNVDWNARGQRTKIRYGADIETQITYDDETFRLERIQTTRDNDGAVLQDLPYTYDPTGNVVEVQDDADAIPFSGGGGGADSVRRFEYDALYRLVRAEGREAGDPVAPQGPDDIDPRDLPDDEALRRYTETYRYDRVGNFDTWVHDAGGENWIRHYAYEDGTNHLRATSAPGDNPTDIDTYSHIYDHDAGGNMVRMPHLPEVDWTHRDQPRRFDLDDGGTVYCQYDADGQRVRKVVDRPGESTEERIYLGVSEILRRRDGDDLQNEVHTLHVMDDQRRIALVETETVSDGNAVADPSPWIRYQLADHLDSATVEVDDSGEMLTYEEYHPFGTSAYRSTRTGANAPPKRYRFTGKERDAAHGLAYHGMRYYMAWLGRWASADPAGVVDGLNLYGYARNNPVRLVDPDGTWGMETYRGKKTAGGENPPRTSGGENPPQSSEDETLIDMYLSVASPTQTERKGSDPSSPRQSPSEQQSALEIVFQSFFELPSLAQMMMSGIPPGFSEYAKHQPTEFTPNLGQYRPGSGTAGAAILSHQSERITSQTERAGERAMWWAQQGVQAINAAQGSATPSFKLPKLRLGFRTLRQSARRTRSSATAPSHVTVRKTIPASDLHHVRRSGMISSKEGRPYVTLPNDMEGVTGTEGVIHRLTLGSNYSKGAVEFELRIPNKGIGLGEGTYDPPHFGWTPGGAMDLTMPPQSTSTIQRFRLHLPGQTGKWNWFNPFND